MQLKYGAYLFPFNATLLDAGLDTEFNSGGLPYKQKRSIHASGYLSVSSQADATLQESALRTALATNFQDLVFYTDDGAPSALKLLNAGSLTGVRIVNLRFPTTNGPEYATIRSFEFTAEAEYPLLNTAGLLLSFQETLVFEGGYPVFAHRLAIEGPNQKQLIWPQDTYRAVQMGSSEGYTSPPTAPAPKWPYALVRAPKYTRTSPQRLGRGYQGYGLTWQYEFEDVGPLIGFPTLWT